jgi:hypothetical protein
MKKGISHIVDTYTLPWKRAHPPCICHVVKALWKIGLDRDGLLILRDAHVKLLQLAIFKNIRHQYNTLSHTK